MGRYFLNQQQLATTIKLGVKSLLLHKLRSGLTMLGMIFGVCSVIAMLAIGNGTEQAIVGEIEGIGTNLLFGTLTCLFTKVGV